MKKTLIASLFAMMCAPTFAGEASLVVPDIKAISLDSYNLLMIGLAVSVVGVIFGLIEFFKVKKIEVHAAMAEVGNTIFETCKTYLVQQGKFLLALERLDKNWTDILNDLTKYDLSKVTLPSNFEIVAEQLLIYFTYRHLSGHLEDGRLSERLLFVIFSYKVIELLCKYNITKHNKLSYTEIAEYARLYSSEIEYSDKNTEAILEKFS